MGPLHRIGGGLALTIIVGLLVFAFSFNSSASYNSSPTVATAPAAAPAPAVSIDPTTRAPVEHYVMPAEPGGSSCAVALTGHDAVIVYRSASLNVQPACAAEVHVQALGGMLWVSAAGIVAGADVTVCTLSDGSGRVTATVLDAGGAIFGQMACTGLISAGWVER